MKTQSRSKRVMVVVIALCTSMSMLSAQPHKDKGHMPPKVPSVQQIDKMVETLSVELKLTESQKATVLELYQKHFNEVREKMEQQKERQKQQHNEMTTLRQEFEKEIKKNLNPEQVSAFDTFRSSHHPGGGAPMPNDKK